MNHEIEITLKISYSDDPSEKLGLDVSRTELNQLPSSEQHKLAQALVILAANIKGLSSQ